VGGALRSSPRGNVLFPGEPPLKSARRASPPERSAGCGTVKLGGVAGTDAFAFGTVVEELEEEDAAVPAAAGAAGTAGEDGVDVVVVVVGTGAGAEDFGGPAGVGRGSAPPWLDAWAPNSGPYAGSGVGPAPVADRLLDAVDLAADSRCIVNSTFRSLQMRLCL